MSERDASTSAKASPAVEPATVERVLSATVTVGAGAVLATAAWLEPASVGHGTHTQLGLGSCSFLTVTGYPCPMCGATTTFALAAGLRPIDAVLNQPFAALLFLMTVFGFAVSLAEVLAPRRRWTRLLDWIEPYEGRLAVAFLALMGLSWVYKGAVMGGVAG